METIQNFVPIINYYFQERYRSPEASLFPVFAARASNRISVPHRGWSSNTGVIASLGLTWALCSFKGLKMRTWLAEWGLCALTPYVFEYLNESDVASKINDRFPIRFLVVLGCLVAREYFRAKLQVQRNPTLSLSTYATYGAVTTLSLFAFGKITEIHEWSDDKKEKFKKIAVRIAALLLTPFVATGAARLFTKNWVKINWNVQLLTMGLSTALIVYQNKGVLAHSESAQGITAYNPS